MEISKSYPYYSIAKKYNLDYGLVLEFAGGVMGHHNRKPTIDNANAINDIYEAVSYFRGVQSGIIPFQ